MRTVSVQGRFGEVCRPGQEPARATSSWACNWDCICRILCKLGRGCERSYNRWHEEFRSTHGTRRPPRPASAAGRSGRIPGGPRSAAAWPGRHGRRRLEFVGRAGRGHAGAARAAIHPARPGPSARRRFLDRGPLLLQRPALARLPRLGCPAHRRDRAGRSRRPAVAPPAAAGKANSDGPPKRMR